MTQEKQVYTLTTNSDYQQEIRKSIFLAQAVPVNSEQQAFDIIQKLSDKQATHNCWAYRIKQFYRSYDDGEPVGTAGRPILQAIEKLNFDGVLVLVTRWFGGIKLGAGGLIRAYGGTAAECLRRSSFVLYVPSTRTKIECSFSDYTLIKARLLEYRAQIKEEIFGAKSIIMDVKVPINQYELLVTRLKDITKGQIQISKRD